MSVASVLALIEAILSCVPQLEALIPQIVAAIEAIIAGKPVPPPLPPAQQLAEAVQKYLDSKK